MVINTMILDSGESAASKLVSVADIRAIRDFTFTGWMGTQE